MPKRTKPITRKPPHWLVLHHNGIDLLATLVKDVHGEVVKIHIYAVVADFTGAFGQLASYNLTLDPEEGYTHFSSAYLERIQTSGEVHKVIKKHIKASPNYGECRRQLS